MNTLRSLLYLLQFIAVAAPVWGQTSSADTAERRAIDRAMELIQKAKPDRNQDTNQVKALLARSQAIGYVIGQAQGSYFRSITLMQHQEYDQVIALLSPFVEIEGNKDLDTLKPYLCIKISEAGLGKGDCFIALKYLEILSNYTHIPQKARLASYTQNAYIWSVLPDHYQPDGYRKALKFCLLAEAMAEKDDNFYNIALLYNNTGDAYAKLQQWDSATVKINEAIAIGNAHHFSYIVQLGYYNLANLYQNKGDLRKALYYNQQGAAIQQTRNPSLYTDLKLQLADIYSQSGQYARLKNVLKEVSMAINKGDFDQLVLYYKVQSRYFLSINDYKNGFEYYKNMVNLRDSVSGVRMLQEANYLDYKYRIVEKDKNIAQSRLLVTQQRSALRKQRLWLWGSISIATIIALTTAVWYTWHMGRRRLELKKNEIDQIQSFVEGELNERERIAMDLHDRLGGLIACIRLKYQLAMADQFSDAAEISSMNQLIADAAQSVREISHNLNPPELIDADLGTALRNYCNSIKTGTALDIKVITHGAVHLSKATSAELLAVTKELIHNVIKHAAATKASITIAQTKTGLQIVVADNGKGFDYEQKRTKGSGLLNLRNRVEKLKGTVSVNSKPGAGTEITIMINQ